MQSKILENLMNILLPYLGKEGFLLIVALGIILFVIVKIIASVNHLLRYLSGTSQCIRRHGEKLAHLQLHTDKLQGLVEVAPCAEWENTRWLEDDKDKNKTPPKRPKCKGLIDDFD